MLVAIAESLEVVERRANAIICAPASLLMNVMLFHFTRPFGLVGLEYRRKLIDTQVRGILFGHYSFCLSMIAYVRNSSHSGLLMYVQRCAMSPAKVALIN